MIPLFENWLLVTISILLFFNLFMLLCFILSPHVRNPFSFIISSFAAVDIFLCVCIIRKYYDEYSFSGKNEALQRVNCIFCYYCVQNSINFIQVCLLFICSTSCLLIFKQHLARTIYTWRITIPFVCCAFCLSSFIWWLPAMLNVKFLDKVRFKCINPYSTKVNAMYRLLTTYIFPSICFFFFNVVSVAKVFLILHKVNVNRGVKKHVLHYLKIQIFLTIVSFLSSISYVIYYAQLFYRLENIEHDYQRSTLIYYIFRVIILIFFFFQHRGYAHIHDKFINLIRRKNCRKIETVHL